MALICPDGMFAIQLVQAELAKVEDLTVMRHAVGCATWLRWLPVDLPKLVGWVPWS